MMLFCWFVSQKAKIDPKQSFNFGDQEQHHLENKIKKSKKKKTTTKTGF